jgi:DNA-binding PadR family transcriptional regulator
VAELSSRELAALRALERRDAYGSEIAVAIRDKLGLGTVYVAMAELHDRGLVEVFYEAPPPGLLLARAKYRITKKGREVLSSTR